MNDPKFIKPFGPCIYSNLITDDILLTLKNCKKLSENKNENVGHLLAGALAKQLRLIITPEQHQKILDHIFEHLGMYMAESPVTLKEKFTFDSDDIWLNIQQAGEFNPAHHHSGEISGVVYLEIPNEILEENRKSIDAAGVGFHSYGQISFYYGEDISCPTYFHMMPRPGQIILFPAKLKHAVNPFFSKVERVSIAFNIIEKSKAKTKNIK